MKCIKTIKKTNAREIGEVIRTEDKEAENRVSSGSWAYCPKSEWKALTRRPKAAAKKEVVEGEEDKPITKRGKNSIQ
jgi:hypothetical protein